MSKKIKVLHLLPNLNRGGAEQVCLDILTGLNEKKFKSAALLFKDNNQGEDKKEKLKKLNISVFSITKKYLIDLVNFYKIIKNIKKYQPDILHTHLGGDIYGPLASYFTKIPIIISTEHNLNYQEKFIKNLLKKLLIKRVNKIYAVSKAVKQDAIKRYNLKEENIKVIYNGIDLNYFKYSKDKKRQKIILGSLGRLNQQKGHSLLIKAIALSKKDNYQLEIAGEGELKNELKKLIKKLNLENKIKLVGQVNNKEWLKKIDIFIMPSLWEGLGIAILEAAAMKKPIIASQVDGILEILNQDQAYLYPPKKTNELAKHIDYLVDNLDSEIVNKKIEQTYQVIKEKFTLKIMIAKYQKIYEDLTS
jgi:glycosyltransferase involved in cell wall biosynthesis